MGVLARLDRDGGRHLEAAERAVAFSLEAQRPDGAWPYGDDPQLQWVDGFHIAYVLDALGAWHRSTGSDRVADALRRGLGLYLDRLIEPDGTPRATLDGPIRSTSMRHRRPSRRCRASASTTTARSRPPSACWAGRSGR